MKQKIGKVFSLITAPKESIHKLRSESLEKAVGDFLQLLILAGLLAGVVHFSFFFLKSAYHDVFQNLSVDYARMINYTFGRSVAVFFFYLFSGTFLLLIASIPLKIFAGKIKYTEFLRILIYSLSPLLLLGWIPMNPLPFIVWGIFLLIVFLKAKGNRKSLQGGIHERE
jgi:hypothetical protein